MGKSELSGTNEPSEREIIYLKFCIGTPKLGILPGHIYRACIGDKVSTREVGWYTLQQAFTIFGTDRVEVTPSSTICPSCQKHVFNELEALE